ncbi:uncharacterized protein LOC129245547 [Anastrepha obliqua]|uniref:uncharacterized protein LOC129245547 n=1 Tax=Anastrepha obliqua TaxID=95512 RepID=UPI002409E96E|nr:uncharacterized protein LOC129245547 [Anastrepha obliqua]
MCKMIVQLLSFLCIILCSAQTVHSCQLFVRDPSPLFSKTFGSKNITFRSTENHIKLNKGESIQAYCGSGIVVETNYNDQRHNQHKMASFFCDENNYIQIRGLDFGRTEEYTIYCSSSSSSSLYESKKQLPNCDEALSYGIGEKIPLIGTIIKLAICYDIETFALKYANYIAYEKKDILISPEQSVNSELGVELEQKVDDLQNYFNFMSQQSFNISRDREPNTFFRAFSFDFESILQDEQLRKQLDKWTYIFNIMWWSQLRQNNWRFFLDALKERANSEKYMVFVGSYGNATMPITRSSSDPPEELAVQSYGLKVTAPMYVWAYVKLLSPSKAEEFVVIGHNSPYVKSPDHTEFCTTDICDSILWLKESKFGHLRRVPTLGYTFCCRAEEVAKIIDNFPMPKGALETTTAAAVNLTTSMTFL